MTDTSQTRRECSVWQTHNTITVFIFNHKNNSNIDFKRFVAVVSRHTRDSPSHPVTCDEKLNELCEQTHGPAGIRGGSGLKTTTEPDDVSCSRSSDFTLLLQTSHRWLHWRLIYAQRSIQTQPSVCTLCSYPTSFCTVPERLQTNREVPPVIMSPVVPTTPDHRTRGRSVENS